MGRFSDEFVAAASERLEELRENSPTLVLAVLVSDDGFEVARTPAEEVLDGRFASMASSVQALSDAVVEDRDFGKNDSVIIQASKGKLIQIRLASSYVLSAQFTNQDLLGRNLIDLRKAASALRKVLVENPE